MQKEDLSQNKPLILVINADKKSCNLIDQWLTRNNYDVLRAYDGETGYQLPTLSTSQTAYKSSEKTAEANVRKITVKSDQAIKKELEDLYRLIK